MVVLTGYAAMPASPSAHVLVRGLGGDAALMATNPVTTQTVGLAAIPLVVIWLATTAFGG